MQIVGYYTWSLKSLLDTPSCEKACPGATGTLYQWYYVPTSSYITDTHTLSIFLVLISYKDFEKLS